MGQASAEALGATTLAPKVPTANGLSAHDLLKAKRFADQLGGVERMKAALEMPSIELLDQSRPAAFLVAASM
jgi:hypothetical protein